MTRRKPRIGILTGGGDCPGLNAVIRAVVKAAKIEMGAEVVGIEYGFKGLIEDGLTRPLQHEAIRGILALGGTVLGTTNRADPFHYLMPDGTEADVSGRALARAHGLGLDALVVVGGDGTLNIGEKLGRQGLPVIGIPKTIDGDVMGTDATIGFDTARAICTEAIDRLATTAEAHDRVMVLEVMGRESGFLALHSGIAGGADAILIPEIPYQIAPIVAELERRQRRGRTFGLVVVAEGARPAGGRASVEWERIPGRGEVKLGGAGKLAADAIAAALPLEVRVTILGHLQRGGTPSANDRILGARFGAAAVRLISEGKRERFIALRNEMVVDVPLAEVRGRRLVDPESELVQVALSLGTSFGAVAGPAEARG